MKRKSAMVFMAWMIGALFVVAGVSPLAAAACQCAGHQPGPQALAQAETAPKDDIKQVPACPFCGMDREKFAHSRVFVQYDDGSVLGTCSIHCAAVDQAVKIDKTPLRIWIGDYKSKGLIDAEKAFWVLGGNKMGVMSKRAKWAFATKEGAEEFIKADGGKQIGFEEALKAAFEDMYEDTKMIRERRKAKRMTEKGMHKAQ